MPTYEYECGVCGLRFERRQPITAAPLAECPACGGGVRRLVSGGVGFIIKNARHSSARQDAESCSLERTGRTCCKRDERCAAPPCEERK